MAPSTNQRVAALLNKLHMFTKSRARKRQRPRRGQKRKHLGYDIPQSTLTCYRRSSTNRPCLFPTEQRDHKGKIKKRYRDQDIATP